MVVPDESSSVVALRKAVAAAGSQSGFARALGISQQAVSKLLKNGRELAPEHVLKAETATGISRHQLRPDIYPIEQPLPPALPNAGTLEAAR